MTLHKDLTGADLHESKGISSATLDQVLRADGAGSGSWQDLDIPSGTFKIVLTEFTSSGTWTKPADFFGMRYHIIGGGGGAGSGGVILTNGGSTSIGILASIGGGISNVSSLSGSAGGSAGTTPSGAKAFTGNPGIANSAGTVLNGYFPLTFDTGSAFNYAIGGIPPGPFGLINKGLGATSPSNTIAAGSGGYSVGWLATASLGATETITIGAGGTVSVDNHTGIAGYCLIEEYITV